nr:unnamed protein product [Spirometra erinaceieuropaei]
MVNFYRRFLPHCADIILPLTSLLWGTKGSFELSADASTVFDKAKAVLAGVTLLTHFSPDVPISLLADASNVGVGAVLQRHFAGHTQPLVVFSRKLSPAETRYSTFGRELLAVFLAVKHFRHFIGGRDFTDFTDHKPLAFALKSMSDKLNHWEIRQLDYISQSTSDIHHIEGSCNEVADAQSRPSIAHLQLSPAIDLSEMAAEQRRPEAIPLPDVAAPTVVKAFLIRWVAIFGAPSTITTDRDAQFESNLFQSLLAILGCTRIHTTTYHSEVNLGIPTRRRRSGELDRTPSPGPAEYSLRFKSDCPAAELVFGVTVRLPSQMISPTPRVAVEDPINLLHRLRQLMRTLSPVPPKDRHWCPAVLTAGVSKMAVTTRFGLFEFMRMPFGLRNVSQTFRSSSLLLWSLAEMTLPQSQLFEDEFPLIRSCPELNEIRIAGEIKDITVEVKDGHLLQAHRIILAARIPSLRVALSGRLGEEHSVLRWPGVPHWLSVENLAITWDFAKSLNVELLMNRCISLMRERFSGFVSSDLFVHLPAETVLGLLRSDNLAVESEEEVIEAIARWVGPDTEAGDEKLKLHAPAMLREVQWHQTTADCRDRLMETYPAFHRSPECAQLMDQIGDWMSVADKDRPLCPFNVRCRQRGIEGEGGTGEVRCGPGWQINKQVTDVSGELPDIPQTFFLFGKEKDTDLWSVYRFDEHLQEAERVADMESRWTASYRAVDESIFVVGGGQRVSEFLVREGRWQERAPYAFERSGPAVAVVKAADEEGEEKTFIGIFGGRLPTEILSSCEVYDVSQDRWCSLPDMRVKRAGPAAASLPGDSRIFVFGGDWRQQAASARSEDFWLPAAPMRTARYCMAATHFRGRILVAGGFSPANSNVVEMFSPPDALCPLGQWTELASMKERRIWPALLTSTDVVFALGGTQIGPKNTVEILSAPGGPTYFCDDLRSWAWTLMRPVEAFDRIDGAASIRM